MFTSDDDPQSKAETRRQRQKERKMRSRQVQQDRLPLSESSANRKGEAWVHWEYNPDEWALFEKIDWGLRGLFFRVLMVGCVISLLVTVAVFFWVIFVFWPGDEWGGKVFASPLMFFVMCPMALTFYAEDDSYSNAKKRHKARQKLPRTITFTKTGVSEAGTFFLLNGLLVADLKRVRLTYQPPVLHFCLRTYSADGSPSAEFTLRVLVPRGQEGEAGLLLERFQTEVIQVREREEERRRQEWKQQWNAQKERKRQKREKR
jgi:hypothetical protein